MIAILTLLGLAVAVATAVLIYRHRAGRRLEREFSSIVAFEDWRSVLDDGTA